MAKLPTNVNCPLEPALDAALAAFCEARGINRSAGTRDLLRHALGLITDEYDAGWREGYAAAVNAVREHMSKAMRAVPSVTF